MTVLQELIAEAAALKATGNAQALDALINDIKGRLLSGETTGDAVLDYAILHKSIFEACCTATVFFYQASLDLRKCRRDIDIHASCRIPSCHHCINRCRVSQVCHLR